MPLNTVRSLVCDSFLFKVVLQHNWVVLPGSQLVARIFCLQLTVVVNLISNTHSVSKNRPRNHPKLKKYQATYHTYLRYTEPKQQKLKTSSVSRWKEWNVFIDRWTVGTAASAEFYQLVLILFYEQDRPKLKEYTPIWFDSCVRVLNKTQDPRNQNQTVFIANHRWTNENPAIGKW